MSNEFDIEKAKAGEPVERSWHGVWKKANFIGMSLAHGDPIVEVWDEHNLAWECPTRSPRVTLRMAPKTVKVRYRVYTWRSKDGSVRPGITDPQRLQVWNAETDSNFIEWIHTDWQEVEMAQ